MFRRTCRTGCGRRLILSCSKRKCRPSCARLLTRVVLITYHPVAEFVALIPIYIYIYVEPSPSEIFTRINNNTSENHHPALNPRPQHRDRSSRNSTQTISLIAYAAGREFIHFSEGEQHEVKSTRWRSGMEGNKCFFFYNSYK